MYRKTIFLSLTFLFAAGLVWLFHILGNMRSGQQSAGIQWRGKFDFTLPDIDGNPVRSTHKDKVTIVNFWASWCTPCLEEMPSLILLAEEKKEKIEVVAVSEDKNVTDVKKSLRAFTLNKNQSLRFTLDPNRSLMQRFGVTGVPESFVISPSGVVLKHIVGTLNWSALEVRKDVDKWLQSF